MKTKTKSTITTAIAVFVIMTMLVGGCFAWFYSGYDMEMHPVNGSIQNVAAYFNGGNGTEGNPYQIANATQMYNLAWLQYLGTFNQEGDGGSIVQTYFVLTDDIDMSGQTLPPIGTATHPFLGSFDGQYYTISNLTVDNEISSNAITDFPDIIGDNTSFQNGGAVDIVGLFGVVGEMTENSYSYNSSVNAIQNLYIDSITVKTETNTSLIGIVAGYVNGTVKNVGVYGNTTVSISATTPPFLYGQYV